MREIDRKRETEKDRGRQRKSERIKNMFKRLER